MAFVLTLSMKVSTTCNETSASISAARISLIAERMLFSLMVAERPKP